MTALKKKSETCEGKLRRMCKNIADSITNPKVYDTADSWIDNAQNSFMEGV